MQIMCKTVFLDSFTVEADETDTVITLKTKIKQAAPFPIVVQRLLLNGKLLADEAKVINLHFGNEPCLIVIGETGDNALKSIRRGEIGKVAAQEAPSGGESENQSFSPDDDDGVADDDDEDNDDKEFTSDELSEKNGGENDFDGTLPKMTESDKILPPMKTDKNSTTMEEIPEKDEKQDSGEFVKKFKEMGFDENLILQTLEKCSYNINRTMENLLAESQKDISNSPRPENKYLEKFLQDPSVVALCGEITDNHELIDDMAAMFRDENPYTAAILWKFKDEIFRRLFEIRAAKNKSIRQITENQQIADKQVELIVENIDDFLEVTGVEGCTISKDVAEENSIKLSPEGQPKK